MVVVIVKENLVNDLRLVDMTMEKNLETQLVVEDLTIEPDFLIQQDKVSAGKDYCH